MAETAKVPVEVEKKGETGSPAPRDEAWMPLEALRREVDRLFDDFRPAPGGCLSAARRHSR